MARVRGQEEWCAVDMEALRQLWRVYRSDPTLRACRDVVVNRLLGKGVMYADAGFARLPGEEFFDHVQRTFVPFCQAAIDSLYVQAGRPSTS